jgi:hypothetical protein
MYIYKVANHLLDGCGSLKSDKIQYILFGRKKISVSVGDTPQMLPEVCNVHTGILKFKCGIDAVLAVFAFLH